MLRLLERNIETIHDRLVLVAPPTANAAPISARTILSPGRHAALVTEMQRLRGSIYVHDGAVQPQQLTEDGLHQTPEDAASWHLLMLDREGAVSSCAWYMEHSDAARFEHLRVRTCPLAEQESWRDRVRHAIEGEMARARREGLRYAEVGGWAVSAQSRCTSEGLLLALAAYSLGRRLGGCLGLTTATVRHSSSTILRRLGGSLLEFGGSLIPSYYDPKYRCEMELLRFDSGKPNPKYRLAVEMLGRKLADVMVVYSADPLSALHTAEGLPTPFSHTLLPAA